MANMRHLRRSNEHRIVQAMLRLGKATRGDLSKDTRMSQPTVGRIVDSLLHDQTLTEIEDSRLTDAVARGSVSVGRPSRYLSLNRSTPRFLGVQLGVRRTRVALLATAPPLQDEWRAEATTPRNADKWKLTLKTLTDGVNLRELEGAVVSLPGVVDEPAGRVLFSPNLRWVEKVDFTAPDPAWRGIPVHVCQEIRLLALGHFVMNPTVKNFLLVDVGSGVGAAVVRDGSVTSSALPLSGELGHSPVLDNDRACSCGAVGCVESLVSRTGLLATAREHHWPSAWPAFIQTLHAKGIPEWMRDALNALATTISAALNLIGMDHVVVTGAINDLPAEATEFLRARIEAGTLWRRFGRVYVTFQQRHRTAGMTAFAIDRLLLQPDA